MLEARPGSAVVVRVRTDVAILDDIAKLVAEKGVDILAVTAWAEGDETVIHIVSDDNLRVTEALRARHFDPWERDVVLAQVPHKPGMLRHVTDRLASEDVNILRLYTSTNDEQKKALVVIDTDSMDQAIVLLNT